MYNNNRITCEISNFYVEIDDIQATFNGNQLSSLSDDALVILVLLQTL